MAVALSLWVAFTTVGLLRLMSLPVHNVVYLKACEESSRKISNFSELYCPLDSCKDGMKGLFASERFPQWFLLCTSKRQFCGVCSSGQLFNPFKGRCVKSTWKSSDHFACPADRLCIPYKTKQGAVWVRKDDRSFILCTAVGNICGFCRVDTRFDLEHQSCRPERTSTGEMDSSNGLAIFDGMFVSKVVSLRNIHDTITMRTCCHECTGDSSLSLISYLRRCRF